MTYSIDKHISSIEPPVQNEEGRMILHFRGSDYRGYLSSTWYDMMDSFVMDQDFTKSKVGSNIQG